MAPPRSCCSFPSDTATPCAPRIAVPGLALRAQELPLRSFHHAHPLASVALLPVAPPGSRSARGRLLRAGRRGSAGRSPAMGRGGGAGFAVGAAGAVRGGAVLLSEQ